MAWHECNGDSILENLESIQAEWRHGLVADKLCRLVAIRSLFTAILAAEEADSRRSGIHEYVVSMAGRVHPHMKDCKVSVSAAGIEDVINRVASEIRPAIKDALFESTKLVRD